MITTSRLGHGTTSIAQTAEEVHQNRGIIAASFTGNQYNYYYGYTAEMNGRDDPNV